MSIAIFGCASRRRPQFKRLHKYLLDMDGIEVISEERPNVHSKSSPGILLRPRWRRSSATEPEFKLR